MAMCLFAGKFVAGGSGDDGGMFGTMARSMVGWTVRGPVGGEDQLSHPPKPRDRRLIPRTWGYDFDDDGSPG